MSKLILGAAQFGLPYGITNYTGKMPDNKELEAILDYAFDNGIDTIDTAEAYGVANERLASYISRRDKKFHIINKVLRYPVLTPEDAQKVLHHLLMARESFNISSFESVMIHHASSISQSRTLSQSFFSLMKERGLCKKFGLSINNESEYFSINEQVPIDLVQLPSNPLNQHISNPTFVQNLQSVACKIHIRSLFLQGLLLTPSSQMPNHLKGLIPYVKKLETLANDLGESVMTLCFVYALSCPFVEGFVVGVQSQRELGEILERYNRALEILGKYGNPINFYELNCSDIRLVDPTQWDNL